MNDVEKHRLKLEQELLEAQKYFFTDGWKEIKSEVESELIRTEDFLQQDNNIIPDLNYSYNSMNSYTIEIMEKFRDRIENPTVQRSMNLVITHNREKFFHFPGLGESRDVKRYSNRDVYRLERQIYYNILNLETSFLKNIGQEDEENDNENENGLDSSLWSGIGFSPRD